MSKYEVVKFVNDEIKLDVNVSPNEDTVWLSQEQIALLFNKSRSTITEHINNIFKIGELDKNTSVGISDGSVNHRPKKLYNLDFIISVGYRVNSKNGIIFRKWATSVLKEYLLKGYAISDRAIITKENYLILTNKVLELDKDVNYIKREIKTINPNINIFYSGEYYKSYVFINKILKEPNKELIIIDPYLDSNMFEYLKNIDRNIKCLLIYSKKAKIFNDFIKQYKKQGFQLFSKIDESYHDRFIVIDNKIIYHIGTSFNYLGAKTFLINKVDDENWVKKFIKNLEM